MMNNFKSGTMRVPVARPVNTDFLLAHTTAKSCARMKADPVPMTHLPCQAELAPSCATATERWWKHE